MATTESSVAYDDRLQLDLRSRGLLGHSEALGAGLLTTREL
jgi:hypothetical protein